MKRRTKVISVLIIIIILLILPPWVDGYLFKKNYQHTIAAVNQSIQEGGGLIQLKIIDYSLGIFHSKATVQITATDKDLAKLFPDGMVFEDKISHGPIVRNSQTDSYTLAFANTTSQLYLPSAISNVVFGSTAKIPFVQANTNISFRGVWDQQLKISPLTLPHLGSLAFQDSSSQSFYQIEESKIQDVQTSSTIGAISFQGNNPYITSVMIQPMTYTQMLKRSSKALWNANSTLAVPNIKVKLADGKEMNLNQLQVSNSKGINAQGLYDSALKFMMNGMTVTNSEFPIFNASSIAIAIRDLNPEGLNEYSNYLKQHPALADNNETAMLQDLAKKLLTPTTRIEVNLNFNTSEGTLKLDSAIGYQGEFTQSANISEIVQNVSTNTLINVSEPILRRFFDRLQILMHTNTELNGATDIDAGNAKSNPMQVQIALLSQSGQITLNQSLQLLELSDQRLTPQMFVEKATEITSADVANQLNESYQQFLTLPVAVDTTANSQTQSVSQKTDAIIAAWIQQGYLTATPTGYSTSFVYSNHQLQLNGKSVADIVVAITPPAPTPTATVAGTSSPLLSAPTDTIPSASSSASIGASTEETNQQSEADAAAKSVDQDVDEAMSPYIDKNQTSEGSSGTEATNPLGQ